MRRAFVFVAISLGVLLVAALARYGTLQPCDMLAAETVRLRAASYDKPSVPGLAVLGARVAYAHRSPGECLIALWRVFIEDPVDVMMDCMQGELGSDIAKAPKARFAAADSKCSSLGWFLWREAP